MHVPVLLQEVIDGLSPEEGDVVFDATVGEGGHTEKICKCIGKRGHIIGFDLDIDAVHVAEERLTKCDSCSFSLFCDNFATMTEIFEKEKVSHIDKALFDLGVRSTQLSDSSRGFSFTQDAPLLMTFGKGKVSPTAHDVVNTWSEQTLATILLGFGEERFSKRIAHAIVQARKEKEIKKTMELVNIIRSSVPLWYTKRRIHFATKTFQAIRIAVNSELTNLEEGLEKLWPYVAKGGRVAVISFHSLEDRIVKNFFREKKKMESAHILTKKPIRASKEEVHKNPRARSARLRVIEK